jgi:hypothetical protein
MPRVKIMQLMLKDNESSLQNVMNVYLQYRVHFPVLADPKHPKFNTYFEGTWWPESG